MVNKKGFAISVVLYAMVILVIGVLYLLLGIVKNRYTVGDKLKMAVIDGISDEISEPEVNMCFLSNGIIDASEESDGLRVDPTDSTRYIYSGSNPNNYIDFNNQTWRIVSIESDGRMKIVLDGYSSTAKYINSTSEKAKEFLTTLMYRNLNTSSSSFYSTLDSTYKSYIVKSGWNFGTVDQSTATTIGVLKAQEKNKSINLSVGLLNVTDFLLASSDNTSATSKVDGYFYANTNNWLYKTPEYWFLNPHGDARVWLMRTTGRIYSEGATEEAAIRPAVYLKAGLYLTGSGTQEDKYRVDSTCVSDATCTISADPGTYSDSQTLKINVIANGTSVNRYSWNGGAFSSNNTLTTTRVGIHKAQIKDNVGRLNSCQITLANYQEYRIKTCVSTYLDNDWIDSGTASYPSTSCEQCNVDKSYAESNGLLFYYTWDTHTVTSSTDTVCSQAEEIAGTELSVCYIRHAYVRNYKCSTWDDAIYGDWTDTRPTILASESDIKQIESRSFIYSVD